MIDPWFEEELIPSEAKISEVLKSNPRLSHDSPSSSRDQIKKIARGIARVDKPRWTKMDADATNFLPSGAASFYIVRLGYQFEMSPDARERGAHFTYARCSAFLSAGEDGQPQPSVYDIFPRDLYEGRAKKVTLKFGPQIKVGEVEGSLGDVSTDFETGLIEPATIGFTGENERTPYWELIPITKTLLGIRHLWLVIESPAGCKGVRLTPLVEADIETRWGLFALGPRVRELSGRPSMLLT